MSFFKKSLKLSNFEAIGSYAKKFASTIDEKTKSFVNEITKDDNESSSKKNRQKMFEEFPYPWSDEIDEDTVKDTVFALSLDERNFLISPTKDDNFEFDLNENLHFAINLLKADKRLEKLRYNIVPKQINEDLFWKNYFYRIHLIKCGKDIKNLPNIFLPEEIPKAEDATAVVANKKKPEELFATDVFDKTEKVEEEEELLKSFEQEIDDAIQLNNLEKKKEDTNSSNQSNKSGNDNGHGNVHDNDSGNDNAVESVTLGLDDSVEVVDDDIKIDDTSSLDETMKELERTLQETI